MTKDYTQVIRVNKETSRIQKEINRIKQESDESRWYRNVLKSQLRDVEAKLKEAPIYLVEQNRIKMELQLNTEYNRMYAEQMTYLKMAKRANDRLSTMMYENLDADNKIAYHKKVNKH